jgi:hypothetical protein
MPILRRPWGDQAYSWWLARQRGDTLTEDEEGALMRLAHFCELPVALQDGLEESPELD